MTLTATTVHKASTMLSQSRGSQQPAPAPVADPDATKREKRAVVARDYEVDDDKEDDETQVPRKKKLLVEPVAEEDDIVQDRPASSALTKSTKKCTGISPPSSVFKREAEASAEDDDDAASVDTVTRFENHRRDSVSHQDTARKAFFKQSNVYKWKGKRGDYIIWAYKRRGNMSKAGQKWPHAFVDGEAQTVNAAMWAIGKTGQLTLATIWTFSPGGDETNQYSIRMYQDDAYALLSDCEEPDSPIPNENYTQQFSVSSGYYKVDAFHCPALENISANEIQELEKKYGSR